MDLAYYSNAGTDVLVGEAERRGAETGGGYSEASSAGCP